MIGTRHHLQLDGTAAVVGHRRGEGSARRVPRCPGRRAGGGTAAQPGRGTPGWPARAGFEVLADRAPQQVRLEAIGDLVVERRQVGDRDQHPPRRPQAAPGTSAASAARLPPPRGAPEVRAVRVDAEVGGRGVSQCERSDRVVELGGEQGLAAEAVLGAVGRRRTRHRRGARRSHAPTAGSPGRPCAVAHPPAAPVDVDQQRCPGRRGRPVEVELQRPEPLPLGEDDGLVDVHPGAPSLTPHRRSTGWPLWVKVARVGRSGGNGRHGEDRGGEPASRTSRCPRSVGSVDLWGGDAVAARCWRVVGRRSACAGGAVLVEGAFGGPSRSSRRARAADRHLGRRDGAAADRRRDRRPVPGPRHHRRGGRRAGRRGAVTWLVDPLDGTSNYAHGIPFACTSVAVRDADGLAAGAIFEPFRGELFTASAGAARGWATSGWPCRPPAPGRALVCTGIQADDGAAIAALGRRMALSRHCRGVLRRPRRCASPTSPPAASTPSSMPDATAWDVGAGALLVTEAGGRIEDLDGGPLNLGPASPTCSPATAASTQRWPRWSWRRNGGRMSLL